MLILNKGWCMTLKFSNWRKSNCCAHPSPRPGSQPGPGQSERRPALHAVWSSGEAGKGRLRLECALLNQKVYQIMPQSEVACPKKDSITASNWGRFLPALQIKSLLKWFVLGGLCPTHHKTQTQPTLIKTHRAALSEAHRGWIHHY